MRAVFLTHYFPPEVGAAPARIAALTRALAAAGVEVAVHTGFPHYPDGPIKPPYRNRPWRVEAGPVPVVRSAVAPLENRGFGRRLADHTALALSACLTAWRSGPADVVVVESPPLFTAAAGVVYARAKRARLVINVADRWPATAVELGALTNPRAIALAERLERWCYAHADRITTPTAGIAAALEDVPEAAGRVVYVAPAVDLDRFDPATPPPADGPLRVLYAGTVGLAQGVETLIEAARLAGPEVVQVTVAGGGVDADAVARQAEALPNLTWLGSVAPDAVPALYAAADAGVVLLRGQPILDGAFPTKLLEVMAAGRPVILSARGESARAVEELGAGLVCAPDDPTALAAVFQRLHDDRASAARMGAAGRSGAEDRYGRDRSVAHWRGLLAELAR